MTEYGLFILSIIAIKVTSARAVVEMPVTISRIHCSKEEARLMMAEHRKQRNHSGDRQHYTYDWQPERVALDSE